MNFQYFSAGKNQTLNFQPLGGAAPAAAASRGPATAKKASAAAPMKSAPKASALHKTISAVKATFTDLKSSCNGSINESDSRYMLTPDGRTLMIATDSITVEGVKKADLKRLRDSYGFEEVREGSQGKLLLRSQETNVEAMELAQAALKDLRRRAGVKVVAHPHFVRTLFRPKPSVAGGSPQWNHDNTGDPGIPGADVAAHAAWLITRGNKDIRVAVLDEGVDSAHPALEAVIVAEKDVVDGNTHARPDGDDAHGTACAGIISSQDAKHPGLAPLCSLIGVRIAKGDGNDGWIFDDFDTADAIDWSWNEGRADVLSNSWGGGPAVDVMTNAINRARSKGRGGKGCVVAFAAGNSNGAIDFPGNLDIVITVGASTPWDERKSPVSKDGETWGSCFGPALDLLAPGVKIDTTDISGARGYSSGNFTHIFNGTSSATPHVAAAAALVLSLKPQMKEADVRALLTAACDPLVAGGKWHKEFGWGRLNLFNALRRARRI
jgi:subtilisin family serine protease